MRFIEQDSKQQNLEYHPDCDIDQTWVFSTNPGTKTASVMHIVHPPSDAPDRLQRVDSCVWHFRTPAERERVANSIHAALTHAVLLLWNCHVVL